MSTSSKPPAPNARPIAQPKSMSSRLLTMKFMQRAAASSPASTSPATIAAVKAAKAEEEAAREAALRSHERQGGDAETRWCLSFRAPPAAPNASAVEVSYGVLCADDDDDDDDDDEEEEGSGDERENAGRMVFGGYKTRAEREREREEAKPPPTGSDEEDSSEGSEDDGDPEDPRARVKPKLAKRPSRAGLSSEASPSFISSAGRDAGADSKRCQGCGQKGHLHGNCPDVECYACGGKGHMAGDCDKARGKKRKEDGRVLRMEDGGSEARRAKGRRR